MLFFAIFNMELYYFYGNKIEYQFYFRGLILKSYICTTSLNIIHYSHIIIDIILLAYSLTSIIHF